VPAEPTVLMAAQTDRPIPAVDTRAAASDAVPAVSSNTGSSERVKIVYQVKKGDTLSSIARLFQTTVSSLKTWNGIPGSQIKAGERLTIYSNRAR
jgi:LysM repeat protein